MNFLITGGCGYIGTQLTKHLLSKRNKVTIVDNCWFGNFHKKNKMLKIIKKDVRNFEDLNITLFSNKIFWFDIKFPFSALTEIFCLLLIVKLGLIISKLGPVDFFSTV